MVDVLGPIDYDKIMEKIKAIIDANEFKVIIIDSAGNIISDISLSALRDALLDDLKGAYRLGAKDLTVDSDEILNVASGVEIGVKNLTIKGRVRVKGILDVFGDLDVIGELDVLGEVNVGV